MQTNRTPRAVRRRVDDVREAVYEAYDDEVAEAVYLELHDDEMYCWLVAAESDADDYGHERWKELDGEITVDDALRSELRSARVALADAAWRREEQLVSEIVDGETPEYVGVDDDV